MKFRLKRHRFTHSYTWNMVMLLQKKYIRFLISKENKLKMEVNLMQPCSEKIICKASLRLSELQGLDRILEVTKSRVPLTW